MYAFRVRWFQMRACQNNTLIKAWRKPSMYYLTNAQTIGGFQKPMIKKVAAKRIQKGVRRDMRRGYESLYHINRVSLGPKCGLPPTPTRNLRNKEIGLRAAELSM